MEYGCFTSAEGLSDLGTLNRTSCWFPLHDPKSNKSWDDLFSWHGPKKTIFAFWISGKLLPVYNVVCRPSPSIQHMFWHWSWGSLAHLSLRNCPHVQPGRSSSCALFLLSCVFVARGECGFALFCWKMCGTPWKICGPEGTVCCSEMLLYLSALKLVSQSCTDTVPYSTEPGCWTRCWYEPLVLPLWSGTHAAHFLLKGSGLQISLTAAHVLTVRWSVPDASGLRDVSAVSGQG